MTDWLSIDIICVLVLLTLVSVYVVVPMRLRRHCLLPMDLGLERVRLNEDVPSNVARFFLRAAHELETEGFTSTAEFYRARFSPEEAVYVTVLVNQMGSDLAYLFGSPPRSPDPRVSFVVGIEFQTIFQDEHEIVTRNASRGATNLPRANPILAVLLGMKDARTLHRVHMALVDRFGGPSAKRPLQGKEARDWLLERYQRDLAAGVTEGYFDVVAEDSAFRLSRKGAFFWTWRNLWPVSSWLAFVLQRKTAEYTLGLSVSPSAKETVG